jgi:hypothetical protein
LELILGDEIVDETDALVDVNDPESTVRRSQFIGGTSDHEGALGSERSDLSHQAASFRSAGTGTSIDWESRLRLLDERLVDEHLSPEEVRAVTAHLKTNYPRAVELISDHQLQELLTTIPVSEIPPAETCHTAVGNDDECSGVPEDKAELLYERGVPTDFCTIVLSGKIMVMSGADRFRSDVSNWGVLATRALTDPTYIPDFTAWVLPNSQAHVCRCVKFSRSTFASAVDNTAVERTGHDIINSTVTVSSSVTFSGVRAPSRSQDEFDQSATKSPDEGKMEAIPEDIETPHSVLNEGVASSTSPPTTPSRYVRTNEQQKTNKRRSKLLRSFMNSTTVNTESFTDSTAVNSITKEDE